MLVPRRKEWKPTYAFIIVSCTRSSASARFRLIRDAWRYRTSWSGTASRSNRAHNSASLSAFVMSLVPSRHHRVHPAPREALARTVNGAPSRGIIAELPQVQINLECGELPTQNGQADSHVHVMHPEIPHWFKHFSIGAGEDWVAASDGSGRQVLRDHAATR